MKPFRDAPAPGTIILTEMHLVTYHLDRLECHKSHTNLAQLKVHFY